MSGAFKSELNETIEIKKPDMNPFQTPATPKTPMKDDSQTNIKQGEDIDYQAMIDQYMEENKH
tara:strand:+ start:933 stop:1121 length:189 start_codon:yes stop_codon:yes gene_type:complete